MRKQADENMPHPPKKKKKRKRYKIKEAEQNWAAETMRMCESCIKICKLNDNVIPL